MEGLRKNKATGKRQEGGCGIHLQKLEGARGLMGSLSARRQQAFITGAEWRQVPGTRGVLVRDDVRVKDIEEEVWTRVRHSKTIQCGERQHWVPLRRAAVPSEGTQAAHGAHGRGPGDSALFVVEKVTGRRVTAVPMTQEALVEGIKALAERVGLDPASYAGPSLRRGAATAAMRLDVNSMYIKMQGDWKSDCFERYCELDTEQKLVLPGAMAEAAATATAG
eukprot:gene13802-biopygen14205